MASATKWGIEVLAKVRPKKSVNINWDVGKYKYQLPCIQADAGKWEKKLQKFNYLSGEVCQHGLLDHDQLSEYEPVIKEARRRMTEEEVQARYFRVNRAQMLNANSRVLPEDQWTPMDAEHNYLDPHIHTVKHEMMERKMVKCAMLDFDDGWDRLATIPFRIANYWRIRQFRDKLRSDLVTPQLV